MKQLKKLQTLIVLTLILTLSIPSLVQAKSGEEIQAFKKFLQKERQKYCFGDKLDDMSNSELSVWYSFVDINGDGKKELLVTETNSVRERISYLYSYRNKQVKKTSFFITKGEGKTKEFQNKKYRCTENFSTPNGAYQKRNAVFGVPIYRVKGTHDLVYAGYLPGAGASVVYKYYQYKNGGLYEKSGSILFHNYDGKAREGWQEWKIQDSYLYKNHNLKGKLIKIKYPEEKHLISVSKDYETGNIIVNTDSY